MLPVGIQELRSRAEEDLYLFAKGILGYDWLNTHIHLPVCQRLMDRTKNRKLIVLPRGWLKTTLCSIAFPIWLSVKRPNIRVLIVQNSHANACKKLAVIRGQWEGNGVLRTLYPQLLPGASSVWKADSLCLTRTASFPESTYEAAGTSTRVVSRHYDVVIEDDTVAPDYDELGGDSLAPTSDDVEKAIGWHRTNVLPLLNNPMEDLNLVVGTRWYDHDLIRFILDHEKNYDVISRACKENNEGFPDQRGTLTYPERFNQSVLDELEQKLGPYMFNCLYMNSPVRSEDMVFRPEWFQYYDTPPNSSKLAIYTTIDTAGDPKLAKSSDTDFCCVMTTGKDLYTGEIFILDYMHKRCSPGELCEGIFDHVRRFRPILVGYQDVAYERSIDYWLKELMRQNNRFFILEPLKLSNVTDAKVLRISGLQPLFANGVIKIKPGMKELVSELLKFPMGAHDDLADALSMQLALWRTTRMAKGYQSASDDGPLSFVAAVEELKSRCRGSLSSSVFDPSRTSSSLYTGTFH